MASNKKHPEFFIQILLEELLHESNECITHTKACKNRCFKVTGV